MADRTHDALEQASVFGAAVAEFTADDHVSRDLQEQTVPTTVDAIAITGLILYAMLLIGALFTVCDSYPCLRQARAGAALIIYSASRLCWEAAGLMPASAARVIVGALSDAVANAGFYAYVGVLVLRTGPSSSVPGALGVWRAGARLTKISRCCIGLWFVVVISLTAVETGCLIADRDVSPAVAVQECQLPGQLERVGMALGSLLVAAALATLCSRVLALHGQAATPIRKPRGNPNAEA